MIDKKDVEKRIDIVADVIDFFSKPSDRFTLKTKSDKDKSKDEIELLELVKREGDRQEWYTKDSKYHCILKRNMHMGFWLGYVGIPASHPCYKMGYDDVYEKYSVDVHGGLTYSGWHPDDETWNQPPPYLSRNEKYWYLGFDCGHAWDLSPFDEYGHIDIPVEKYRTKGYAKREVNALAKQLAHDDIVFQTMVNLTLAKSEKSSESSEKEKK